MMQLHRLGALITSYSIKNRVVMRSYAVSASEWRISDGDGFGGKGLRASRGPAEEKTELTVIFLHGLGDTAQGWIDAFVDPGGIRLLPERCDIILPTAESRPITINNGMNMPGWYDIKGLSGTSPVDTDGIAASVDRISTLIQSVDSPVILGGFSQGGAISLSLALSKTFPSLLGVIGASCYLPNADSYQKSSTDPNLHILLCHGDYDQVIPPEAAKITHSKLVALGLTSNLLWYRGMAHSACPEEFQAISTFIQERLLNSSSSSSSSQ